MKKHIKPMMLLLLIIPGFFVSAQEKTSSEKQTKDTTSLLHALKKGQLHGHIRYFFMATDNKAGLSDYYANAAGGFLKFETGKFRGFQLGMSGSVVFNIGSSDLSKKDPKTNQPDRYEIGLFDITDPSNKKGSYRLDECYVKYSWKKSNISVGRQHINTPFIHSQDGRMRPTVAGGILTEINDIAPIKLEAGYLYEISPRSTERWYRIDHSIGINPVGVDQSGNKSNYDGNISSKGIAFMGISTSFNKNFSIQLHDVFVENIFNTSFIEADYFHSFKNERKLIFSMQYTKQFALNDGGNHDVTKTYITKHSTSQTIGAKLGWENKRWQTSLNYNRITAAGRYLMPREWGHDPFFTYLPRERNEGLGDVHAYLLKAAYSVIKERLNIQTGIGYYDLPEVTNYKLNKYGLPSYTQLNADLEYTAGGWMKGIDARLLFVYKGKAGKEDLNEKYVINKVDMREWNFILNYNF